MPEKSLLNSEDFWKTVLFLERQETEISISDICQKLNVSYDRVYLVIYFLRYLNIEIDVKKVDDQEIIIPPQERPKIEMQMSLSEWLAFQAHFPKLTEYQGHPFHQLLIDKLVQLEQKYLEYDLYGAISSFDLSNYLGQQKLSMLYYKEVDDHDVTLSPYLKKIQDSITMKNIIIVSLRESNNIEIYPHRLVYFDDGLVLVAEDTVERCIVFFKVSEIDRISSTRKFKYKPNFTSFEVDKFIKNIRSLSGTEIRLILKINTAEEVSLSPLYHYLNSPCVITNGQGELIWAASVEPCEDLYRWIMEMGSQVEVLDPPEFKEEFKKYSENHFKKMA